MARGEELYEDYENAAAAAGTTTTTAAAAGDGTHYAALDPTPRSGVATTTAGTAAAAGNNAYDAWAPIARPTQITAAGTIATNAAAAGDGTYHEALPTPQPGGSHPVTVKLAANPLYAPSPADAGNTTVRDAGAPLASDA
jgi:hypothetical protein